MNETQTTTVLSIVCPAYQEEEALPSFHKALCESVEPLASEWFLEILYVDDGSRDGTLSVIRRLASQDPRVKYVSLSRNFGHQAALSAGLEYARGDLVVSLDTDLQHPPALIPTLVAKAKEGYDVVLTIRSDDQRQTIFKRLSSSLFYKLLARVSDLDVRPAASDFRLMSRRAVDALIQLNEPHRYLRGMVQWLGFPTAEVPFQPDIRRIGKSKYTIRKMVRFASDGLYSFSPMPVQIAVGTGLAVTGMSWVACIVGILLSVSMSDPVARVGLIGLTAIHLLIACVLVALGVVGEYARRIYMQGKGRPNFVVKETNNEAASVSTRLRSPRAA